MATVPPRQDSAPPTLRDVAEVAGVSVSTASRVLNGSTKRVAESLQTRVEKTARDLGYAANPSAQAMAGALTRHITLLIANLTDPYYSQIAEGAHRAAVEHDLSLSVIVAGGGEPNESRVAQAVRTSRPRAVVLALSKAGLSPGLGRALHELKRRGSRIVSLGRPDAEATVAIPNRRGAAMLGSALRELGYREAHILADSERSLVSGDRSAGFVEGFAGHIAQVHRPDTELADVHQTMRNVLTQRAGRESVVFAVNDSIALAALSAMHSNYRSDGAGVAFALFSDSATANGSSVLCTHVRLPLVDYGRAAIGLVVGGQDSAKFAALGEPIVSLRSSTARVARS